VTDFARRTALKLGLPVVAHVQIVRLLFCTLICAQICATMCAAVLASSSDGEGTQDKKSTTPSYSTHIPKSPVATSRLVSLAPSNTELLCSIGAKSEIIGVCSFCDYPREICNVKPVGTFVSVNMERLCRLKPDYVLLVSGQEMLASQLAHNNFKTLILDNSHLANISKNLKFLGNITGKTVEASLTATNFEQALCGLKSLWPSQEKQPTVFYCVWPQPLMTAGRDSFLNEVITACGGTNIAAEVPSSYPRYSMEQLVLKNPDVIILPYEARGQSFLTRAPWTMLKAVKEKRLYYLPDQKHDTLSRPTMRVLSGLAWLSTILHPERKAELDAWQKSESFERALKATGPAIAPANH